MLILHIAQQGLLAWRRKSPAFLQMQGLKVRWLEGGKNGRRTQRLNTAQRLASMAVGVAGA
ncbi:MAG: hypothetical protein RR882_17595, partial [Comamonas sp.]